MKDKVYINGYDAYERWKIVVDDSFVSALMTPAPMKSYPTNESRLEVGKRYFTSRVKQNERTLNLTFQLLAHHKDTFFARYASFCEELGKGTLTIETTLQEGVKYHLLYTKCTQFQQFDGRAGKFVLSVTEPDPSNRR